MLDFNKADFEVHEQCISQANRDALRTVEAMNLPIRIHVSSDSFAGLGAGILRRAEKVLTELTEKYGKKLPYLIGIALRQSHYEVCCGAYYCAAIGSHASFCTPEGYGQSEGWANSLYAGLERSEEDSALAVFRIGTPFSKQVSSRVILNCIALYWFLQASSLNKSGDALGAQDLIFEGLEALSICMGTDMWDAGVETSREDNLNIDKAVADGARKKMLSMAGMLGAKSRHRPYAEIKEWALTKAAGMRGPHTDVARKLSAQLPAHLADASKDPERLIYDALRMPAKPN